MSRKVSVSNRAQSVVVKTNSVDCYEIAAESVKF